MVNVGQSHIVDHQEWGTRYDDGGFGHISLTKLVTSNKLVTNKKHDLTDIAPATICDMESWG